MNVIDGLQKKVRCLGLLGYIHPSGVHFECIEIAREQNLQFLGLSNRLASQRLTKQKTRVWEGFMNNTKESP